MSKHPVRPFFEAGLSVGLNSDNYLFRWVGVMRRVQLVVTRLMWRHEIFNRPSAPSRSVNATSGPQHHPRVSHWSDSVFCLELAAQVLNN